MAYFEQMTIKEIAVGILQLLKIIARKTPEPNSFGWSQTEIKAGTLTTLTTLTTLSDYGINIWIREQIVARTNTAMVFKNLVVKS